MAPHSRLEYVPLVTIEICDATYVREESLAAPGAQESHDDRLSEGGRLQVRNGRLRARGE